MKTRRERTWKDWKNIMKQKRQDNIDEFAKAVDEELKKYDPKDLNTDWHDEWRDAMEENSDEEVA